MRSGLIAVIAAAVMAGDAGATAVIHSVAGSGVHYFTTAIVHATETTPTGMIQRSTETVELTGDLTGRILYQPTSVFDFAGGTLVNTGHQVFSGTVLGSAPVLLHDDEFRFEASLVTGAVSGKVYLTDPIAGDKIRCELDVVGSGLDASGNATFNYTGHCRIKTNH
jgi:hypothetical protein